jgi:Zn-dependent protease with chaperone function
MTTKVEEAWAARRVVDPAQLDDARLGRYRHPRERRALLTIASIIVGIELLLLLLGPDRREAIRAQLHWVPSGILGAIMSVLRPGGVGGTVLGFLLLTALLDLYSHWMQRAKVLSETTEVTATTLPGLYPLVEELRERFALPSARVFVDRAAPQPYSLGMYAPYFIVIPAAWLAMLSQDELRFVLGHEMGHIRLGHTRVAPFLGGGDWSGPAILSVLSQIRSLILSSYQQATELSGDRIGVVAGRAVGPALSAAIKTGLGTPKGAQIDVATLAAQAAEVHRGTMALAGRLRRVGMAQPPTFFRLKELVTWAGLPKEQPPKSAQPVAPPTATTPVQTAVPTATALAQPEAPATTPAPAGPAPADVTPSGTDGAAKPAASETDSPQAPGGGHATP